MIKPYLTYKEDDTEHLDHSSIYKGCNTDGLEDTKEVINNPHGTLAMQHAEWILHWLENRNCRNQSVKEDTTGTELGWFLFYNGWKYGSSYYDYYSEDVKERWSGYVVKKIVRFLKSGCLIISIGFLMEISGCKGNTESVASESVEIVDERKIDDNFINIPIDIYVKLQKQWTNRYGNRM